MCMNKKIASNGNKSVEYKGRIRLLRPAIITKTSKDEPQKHTVKTTKIITSKTLCQFKKNLLTRSKQLQIKLKLNKINCTLLETICDHSIIRLGNNQTKKNKRHQS